MFILDLILKKRNGMKLNWDEIEYFVRGYTNGDIEDYQAVSYTHLSGLSARQ